MTDFGNGMPKRSIYQGYSTFKSSNGYSRKTRSLNGALSPLGNRSIWRSFAHQSFFSLPAMTRSFRSISCSQQHGYPAATSNALREGTVLDLFGPSNGLTGSAVSDLFGLAAPAPAENPYSNRGILGEIFNPAPPINPFSNLGIFAGLGAAAPAPSGLGVLSGHFPSTDPAPYVYAPPLRRRSRWLPP